MQEPNALPTAPPCPPSPDAVAACHVGHGTGGFSAPRPRSCARGQQVAQPGPASSIFFLLIGQGLCPRGRERTAQQLRVPQAWLSAQPRALRPAGWGRSQCWPAPLDDSKSPPNLRPAVPPGSPLTPQERGLSEEQVPFARLPPGRAGHQPGPGAPQAGTSCPEAARSQTCPVSGTRGPKLPRSQNLGLPSRLAGRPQALGLSVRRPLGTGTLRALSWPGSLASHLPLPGTRPRPALSPTHPRGRPGVECC